MASTQYHLGVTFSESYCIKCGIHSSAYQRVDLRLETTHQRVRMRLNTGCLAIRPIEGSEFTTLKTNPLAIQKKSTAISPIRATNHSFVPGEKPGRVLREVLGKSGRTKLNLSSDRDFYTFPRFVTHVDDGFLRNLTELYRQKLPDDSEILDLMSSWVSHLPPEKNYKRVVGHGLNAAELARNKQLSYFFVKDLNQDQKLELEDAGLDAVLCTVSIQYLQEPEKIFAEIYRILRPGGVCIVSFSNRMFYDKAIAAWRDTSEYGRTQLVRQYFQCIQGFTEPEVVTKLQSRSDGGMSPGPLSFIGNIFSAMQGTSRDPFYAVVAYRNFKPVFD